MPDTFVNDATERPVAGTGRRPDWQDMTVACVGIVWHPEPDRIGMIAPLVTGGGDAFHISRHEPHFRTGNGQGQSPLGDRHVSRQPVLIRRTHARTFEITPPDSPMRVSVNGREINRAVSVSLDELGEDILIGLSGTVILSIFEAVMPFQADAARHGLIGVSKGVQQAWSLIRRAAPTDLPVLLTGATGTGKELAAAALHALSPRAAQKLHIVNMASLPAELAHAELFGAAAGSYTGATSARTGVFAQAHGGTLFMDEIGDTPDIVQPMLLRALESGEYRRLGDTRTQVADVRVISATDRSLEAGDFNQPLRHRLQAITIRLPPLCARRVDIGLLLSHFLTRPETNLPDRDPRSIPAGQVLPLLLHAWPGNVRELVSVARQMRMGMPVTLIPAEAPPAPAPETATPVLSGARKHRDPMTVDDGELTRALEAAGWNIKAAAAALNVSRTSLYRLIERSPGLRSRSFAGRGDQGTDDLRHGWTDNLNIARSTRTTPLSRNDIQ